MPREFWHHFVTEKSFLFLQDLAKYFRFVLIGGWAVFMYTKALKSKDIDIVADFEELGKLRQHFQLVKNDRLKKYEIRGEGFDVDIYVPHWSELGLPSDVVMARTIVLEGFRVPQKEILLALKLFVWLERKSSLKGKKDMIDIITLLHRGGVSLSSLSVVLVEHNLTYLLRELRAILETTYAVPELDLNRKQFSDFKKPLLKELRSLKLPQT